MIGLDDALIPFAEAVGHDGSIAVEGGRSRWEVGGTVDPTARLVQAPVGIVEYHPEEMTVRVRAGTTVEALHAALADAGQRSALPERGGTVGGALAVGENHLDVALRGTVRSAALGVRYVSAEGRVVSAGGPTVKNVTGFDLTRLLVGSLGTLGLIAEAVLRTNPVPAASRWYRSDDAAPDDVALRLRAPATVLWDGTATWVHLEGHNDDLDELRGDLAARAQWEEVDAGPDLPDHRWSLPPAEIPAFARNHAGRFVASVGVGTVFADLPQGPRPVAEELRRLGRRAKQEFDPRGRLNPGRDPMRR